MRGAVPQDNARCLVSSSLVAVEDVKQEAYHSGEPLGIFSTRGPKFCQSVL